MEQNVKNNINDWRVSNTLFLGELSDVKAPAAENNMNKEI